MPNNQTLLHRNPNQANASGSPTKTAASKSSNKASTKSTTKAAAESAAGNILLPPGLDQSFSAFVRELDRQVRTLYDLISKTTIGSLVRVRGKDYFLHTFYRDKKRTSHYVSADQYDQYRTSIANRRIYLEQWKALRLLYNKTSDAFFLSSFLPAQNLSALIHKKARDLPWIETLSMPTFSIPLSDGSIQFIRDAKPFHPEALMYQSAKGERMRSANEVIISDGLFRMNLDYFYEPSILIHGVRFYPDFLIRHPISNEFVIWEHFGMMDNPDYVERAAKKLAKYADEGFYEGKNLIVTRTSAAERISSAHISRVIFSYFRPDHN